MTIIHIDLQRLKQINSVAEVRTETALVPGNPMLEITEDAMMAHARYAIEALEELKSKGGRLRSTISEPGAPRLLCEALACGLPQDRLLVRRE